MARGALAGDDLRVVVRMNQDRARFFLEDFAGGVSGSDVVLAFGDAAAVGLDGLTFGARRCTGHDDPRGNAATSSGERNGCGMISGRLRDHAEFCFGVGEREYGVGGSAKFERACFLKILALEKQMSAGHVVERFGSKYRSAMNVRANARVSRTNRFEIWRRVGTIARFTVDIKKIIAHSRMVASERKTR